MDQLIGRKLKGKFRITARIGEGAMGTVYEGVQTDCGRYVAIKIMHPALMKEPGMLTRFRREATAMRRVRHPNAIEVFGHGVDGGLVFLAMELVEGRDLADRMSKGERFTPARVIQILASVLSALTEAHAHGVVHRDIKPENILIGGANGETVKLIDFGIAKSGVYGNEPTDEDIEDRPSSIDDSIPDLVCLADEEDLELTTAGTLVGSPGYMAPEQWAGSKVDARTDVYACGVLLYQLLTGRLPFEDELLYRIAARQLGEIPEAPHALNPQVPQSLSTIILRALRPNPDDRFASAAELRKALLASQADIVVTERLGFGATLPAEVISPLAQQPEPSSSPFGSTLVMDRPAAPVIPLPVDIAAQSALASTRVESPVQASFEIVLPPMAGATAPRTLPFPDDEPATQRIMPELEALMLAPPSIPSPWLLPPPVAAQMAPPPPSARPLRARRMSPLRFFLPLAATALALGLLVGILLFFPVL